MTYGYLIGRYLVEHNYSAGGHNTPIVTGGWQPKRDNFNFGILYWGIVFFDMDLKSALFDTGNSLRLILYTYTMSAMMNGFIMEPLEPKVPLGRI